MNFIASGHEKNKSVPNVYFSYIGFRIVRVKTHAIKDRNVLDQPKFHAPDCSFGYPNLLVPVSCNIQKTYRHVVKISKRGKVENCVSQLSGIFKLKAMLQNPQAEFCLAKLYIWTRHAVDRWKKGI